MSILSIEVPVFIVEVSVAVLLVPISSILLVYIFSTSLSSITHLALTRVMLRVEVILTIHLSVSRIILPPDTVVVSPSTTLPSVVSSAKLLVIALCKIGSGILATILTPISIVLNKSISKGAEKNVSENIVSISIVC